MTRSLGYIPSNLKFASGQFSLPRSADFTPEIEHELLNFPQAKYDDIVDAISQALAYRGYGYDKTYSGFQD